MYQDELDKVDLYYVCRFTVGGDTEEDYRAHIKGMTAAIDAASATPARLTIMIAQGAGYPPPNAYWRQIVAEMTGMPTFRAVTAIVSPNTVLRGVLTALNWLRPKHYVEEIHADAATAFEWLEKQRGQPLGKMRAIAARVGITTAERRSARVT